MAIDDVDVPGSAGWWFKRLAKQQADRARDLAGLQDRYDGKPPLPVGAEQAQAAYQAFQKLARTNYESVIVRQVLNRQTPIGFRTAAADDDGGDRAAAQLWAVNEMAVQASEILEAKLALREGYAIVGPPTDDSEGLAVITAEDPRQVITAHDPVRASRVRAGLKTFWDPDLEEDVAYVYLPAGAPLPAGGTSTKAVVRRATRKGKTSLLGPNFRMSPKAWDWDEGDEGPVELPIKRCPVVRFRNRGGYAEFEKHLDLIDRIRHTILQRMVIITMQAFRQRAVKNLPKHYPDDYPVENLRGQEIDYSGVFVADPAAIWMLPGLGDKAAEIWESGTLDLTPVLTAIKDDVKELATVSFMPFFAFMPDGANQTAEGATTQREGLVFNVEDHNTRDGISFAQVMSLAFEMQGDTEGREKLGQLETLWAPVERHSLAQKADAGLKAHQQSMSARTILTDIWQMTPEQAQRELDARANDFLFAVDPAAAAPVGPAGQPAAAPGLSPEELKDKADALGTLVRAGVEPLDAARQVGLPGLDLTGATPVARPRGEGA